MTEDKQLRSSKSSSSSCSSSYDKICHFNFDFSPSKSVDVNCNDKRRQEDIGSLRKTYLNDERVTGESCATSDQTDQFYSDCDSTLNKIIRMNSDDSLNQENSYCAKMEFTGRSKDSVKNRDQLQFEIGQQGPDLQQDSPRSTRSSPKINAGSGNVSMNNSPALQHKNLPVTESSSPSPPPPLYVPASSFQQNPVQQQTLFSPSSQSQNYVQQPAFSVSGATQSTVSNSQLSSVPPAMIFGPNTNPGGYYYSSYPQLPPVRPMVSYEHHNIQQQQPPVYYQPFMNAMMAPGGVYYAPQNMAPYVVNAQSMPWIQAHTDFSQMNYPSNANFVYSPHHQPMPQQQHYMQSYQNPRAQYDPSLTPENVQYRDDGATISAPSTPREDIEQHHQPNIMLRRSSLKMDKQTLSMSDKSDVIHANPQVLKFNEPILINDREKMLDLSEKVMNSMDYNEQNNCSNMETIASTNVSDSPRHGTNRYHTGAKLELEHGRTPLFGACPTWWGENEADHDEDECLSLNVQSEYQRKTSPQFQRKSESASDTEGRSKKYEPANFQPIKHSIRENIRMDIPFSSIEPAEQEDPAEKNKSRASNATSFTIEFTPNKDANKRRSLSKPIVESKAEDQWKMQSAERVHKNFIRRSLRKAGGITPETHPLTSAINAKNVENKEQELRETAKDPKAYLLNKMLTSESEEAVKLPRETKKPIVNLPPQVEIRPRRNSDAGSDAGTYVVNCDQELEEEIRARLQIDQVFGVASRSRSSSSSCERTPSPLSYEEAIIIPRKPVVSAKPFIATSKALPTRNLTQTSVSQSLIDKEEEKKKKGLLKQLLKISQQPDHRRSLPASTTVVKLEPTPPARRSILKKNNSAVGTNYGPPLSNSASINAGSFSRAEHGRLSLRSTSCNNSAPVKPPIAAAKPKVAAVKSTKDNEMNLWLRRKEYNPMKAAAEAKTKKIQPSSSAAEPAYLSNRSQSFHTGAILPKGSLRKHQSIEDSLGDSDLDPHSESASVASFSRNFAASLNRLSRGVESDGDVVSRRSKALDSDSIILARLSKELGSHAKDVLSKLNASNSGCNVSKSVDNVFNCADDPSEEDSLEHSNSAGITGLVRQLELANQAFEVVGTFLKNQTENSTGEPADPASDSTMDKNFRIRRTHLTKLETKLNDSQNRNLTDSDTF